MNFSQAPEFQKDLKRLAKKWRSLPGDLKDAELQITSLYIADGGNAAELAEYRAAFFNGKRATILLTTETHEVVKMRLDVADLNSRDKVRVVFVAVRTGDEVLLVEMYAKNEKDREDEGRIRKYL